MDVALDYVFDSHEGFTRAFSKAFGINPKKYSDYPKPYGWLIPYRYLERSNIRMEDSNMDQTYVIFTQIIERPARKLILLRGKRPRIILITVRKPVVGKVTIRVLGMCLHK